MPGRPVPEAIAPGQESVWDYPRPPAARFSDEEVIVVLGGEKLARRAAWYYPRPNPDFAMLVDHVALYAGRMDYCLVDGERVVPQPGGFYGGWITSSVVGPFKGTPGSQFW